MNSFWNSRKSILSIIFSI